MGKYLKDPALAKKIRTLREQKGLNQAELAEAAGITPAAICQIEAAERTPSTPILRRITSVLNVSMDYLLGATNENRMEDLVRNEDIQKFFRNYQSLSAQDQKLIKQQIEFLKSRSESKK